MEQKHNPAAEAKDEVLALYRELIYNWNKRNAAGMAVLMTEDACMIGFDGSEMRGNAEVAEVLGDIFAHHLTAAYVCIIREVRVLSPDTALLRAVVGMVPDGYDDINPAVNAVQSMVAAKDKGQWRIALFQNTPAALHGRPEMSEQISAELRKVLKASRQVN
jgi:uncharacterized protein (TIGR02246 family)